MTMCRARFKVPFVLPRAADENGKHSAMCRCAGPLESSPKARHIPDVPSAKALKGGTGGIFSSSAPSTSGSVSIRSRGDPRLDAS
jgi:hypothetical protein